MVPTTLRLILKNPDHSIFQVGWAVPVAACRHHTALYVFCVVRSLSLEEAAFQLRNLGFEVWGAETQDSLGSTTWRL
ncbi:hypothetical protein IQ268_08595 [Oculatella sp. LEGE 06141]|uniref:hypothetical protein n=1 Tax=Oculatella sp. LEGE 06141 TaxID=1828648 RepID=UPI001880197D|nr:hypothetical protein [Oculatella sp. LEGE 06141]MBE9178616.1 hypothetical protein [Oculatella sp. LEGE 06141]